MAPPDAGPAPRYPAVPNGGGPTMSHAKLFDLTFAGDGRAASHRDFTAWLASSGWLTERGGEYGVVTVEHAEHVELPGPLPAELDDAALRALIRSALRNVPGALYVVYLPDGTSLVDRFGARTCLSNPGTGYHEHLDAEAVPFVVVPACPARFASVLDKAGSMQLDAARLIIDALTDPSPRNAPAFALTDDSSPWTTLGAEVGDFCWGRFVTRDGRKLQRVWSNAAVAKNEEPCAPAPAGPAFGVSVSPPVLQPMAIAQPVTFTVTGWSSAPRGEWRIEVTPWFGDFTITSSLERTMLNDGDTAQLQLEVPFPVAPGTVGGVLLRAFGEEDTPLWPVSLVTR